MYLCLASLEATQPWSQFYPCQFPSHRLLIPPTLLLVDLARECAKWGDGNGQWHKSDRCKTYSERRFWFPLTQGGCKMNPQCERDRDLWQRLNLSILPTLSSSLTAERAERMERRRRLRQVCTCLLTYVSMRDGYSVVSQSTVCSLVRAFEMLNSQIFWYSFSCCAKSQKGKHRFEFRNFISELPV